MADWQHGRDHKPPFGTKVDYSHPLAQNLAYAMLLNEGTGTKVWNAGYAVSGTSEEGDFNGVWSTGAGEEFYGPHCDFQSVDVIDLGDNSATMIDYSGDNYLSLAILCHVDANNGTLVGKRDGSNAEFQLFESSGTIWWRVGNTSQSLYGSAQGYNTGEWHLHSLSSDNDGTSRHFLDGVLVHDQTTTATPISRPTINVSIGARWNSYPTLAFQLNGQIAFCYIWQNRFLSDFEHAQIAADPYQFFEDRTEKRGFIFIEAAGGPGPILRQPWKHALKSLIVR